MGPIVLGFMIVIMTLYNYGMIYHVSTKKRQDNITTITDIIIINIKRNRSIISFMMSISIIRALIFFQTSHQDISNIHATTLRSIMIMTMIATSQVEAKPKQKRSFSIYLKAILFSCISCGSSQSSSSYVFIGYNKLF